jgi:hypothetical protein
MPTLGPTFLTLSLAIVPSLATTLAAQSDRNLVTSAKNPSITLEVSP